MQELVQVIKQLLEYGREQMPAGVQLELAANLEQQPYLLADCRWQVEMAEWQRYLEGWCSFLQQLKPGQSQQWQAIFKEFQTFDINQLWNYHPGSGEAAWVRNLVFLPILTRQQEMLQPELIERKLTEYCPVCGSPPLLAVLHGQGGARRLVCGTCTARWDFPALACPRCGNRDHETLFYRQVAELPGWQIDGCSKCSATLKVLDLRTGRQDAHPWVLDAESIALNFVDQEEE